jgi:hypothetical protein
MEDKKTGTPAMLRAAVTGEVDMSAAVPGGIEASEKLGQIQLVNSTKMPIELRPNREAFEAVGFRFGEAVDDIFIKAELPSGWSRKATDVSVYSEILDEQGRKRAQVFFKAAFYDRRALANLLPVS